MAIYRWVFKYVTTKDMSDIYYFEDWVSDMLNSSDYNEYELMGFEEYYQNLLPFEENTDIFIKQFKIN